MDITVESAFNVYINNQTILKFLKCGPGLYYFDTDKSNKYPGNNYSFLSTVKDNESHLIRIELERADRALDPQGKVCWPSIKDY